MAVIKGRRHTRKKHYRGRRTLLILALLMLTGLAGGFYYWQDQRASAAVQAPTGPHTVTVMPNTYRVSVSGPGTLQASRSFDVGTTVAGTVRSTVEVGARVSTGQVLLTLEPAPFERALRDAQVAVTNAQAQLGSLTAGQTDSLNSLTESIAGAERSVQDAQRNLASAESALALAKQLHAIGSESAEGLRTAQNAYDQAAASLQAAQSNLNTLRESRTLRSTTNAQDLRNAELNIEQARANLERAEEDLAASTIRAPFDGVVSGLTVQEGSHVSANAAVVTLISDQSLRLVAQIDETEISQVRVGQQAEVRVGALPNRTFEGTVTAVAPNARMEQNIPIFDVTITVDNEALELRPGMTAEADVTVREVESTLTLPTAAVQTVRERSYIQVRQEDGSFAPHPALVVDSLGQSTIVQTDLPPGAVVQVPEGAAPNLNADMQARMQERMQQGGGLPFAIPGGMPGGGGMRGGFGR